MTFGVCFDKGELVTQKKMLREKSDGTHLFDSTERFSKPQRSLLPYSLSALTGSHFVFMSFYNRLKSTSSTPLCSDKSANWNCR